MVPTANDIVAARIADWLHRFSWVLMPAWVGRQKPATSASKIKGQIEVINKIPFPVEGSSWNNRKKIITKARKDENTKKNQKIIRFRVFPFSCFRG
jgi:hypothetical protein